MPTPPRRRQRRANGLSGALGRADLAAEFLRRNPIYRAEHAQMQQRMLQRFIAAMEHPSLDALRALFAEDAVHIADGGGLASATLRPLHGAERLARLYLQIAHNTQDKPLHSSVLMLNGAPALLTWEGDSLVTAMWIECDDERIVAMHALRHPGKLARLAAVTKSAVPTSLH